MPTRPPANGDGGRAAISYETGVSAVFCAGLACGWQPAINPLNRGADGGVTASIRQAQISRPFCPIEINTGRDSDASLIKQTLRKGDSISADRADIRIEIKGTVGRCMLT